MGKVLLLMTEVLHYGTNILGGVLFLAQIGLFILAAESAKPGERVLSLAIILVSVATVSAIDVLVRYGSHPRDSIWRFFRPGSGGTVFFRPVWLWLVGTTIAIAITILAIEIRKHFAAN